MAMVMRLLVFGFIIFAVGCTELPEPAETKTAADEALGPDNFLRTLNQYFPLAAGDFKLVAVTSGPALDGTIDVGIMGSHEEFTWQSNLSNYADTDPVIASEFFSFSFSKSSGLMLDMQAPENTNFYLYGGSELLFHWSIDASESKVINFAESGTNSLDYALAYYAAVDPNDERTTLEDWKSKNGFDSGYQEHVLFRDARDLGYGRDMYGRKNGDGSIAIFVNNYQVKLDGVESSGYTSININPAYEKDSDYLVGTNAIEFSPVDNAADYPGSDEFILKMFTFNPVTGERVLAADLDGRGIKSVPSNCLICHGGYLLPLDQNGKMLMSVLQSAKYNQLELDQFEYSTKAGYDRTSQETAFRTINSWIFDSYDEMATRANSSGAIGNEKGHWDAAFSKELSLGRYGGDHSTGSFQDDFVPIGWDIDDGVRSLYKNVIEPHCIVCHALRGRTVAFGGDANAINFSTYAQFLSFEDRIIDYVFKRGVMPLSLRNFESFWSDPEAAPTILASYLPSFNLYDSNGDVVKPGLPVARVGLHLIGEINSPYPVSGSLSVLADTYNWEIISTPASAVASITALEGQRISLLGDTVGTYRLSLSVTNATGVDQMEFDVELVADNSAFEQLNFLDDVDSILTSAGCTGCHTQNSSYPIYYVDNIDFTNNGINDYTDRYNDIMGRVDLDNPENSLFLQKPTQLQHGGGIIHDISSNSGDYRKILEWIRQGAACGNTASPVCSSYQQKQ